MLFPAESVRGSKKPTPTIHQSRKGHLFSEAGCIHEEIPKKIEHKWLRTGEHWQKMHKNSISSDVQQVTINASECRAHQYCDGGDRDCIPIL